MSNLVISGGKPRDKKPTLKDQAGCDDIVVVTTDIESENPFFYCKDDI